MLGGALHRCVGRAIALRLWRRDLRRALRLAGLVQRYEGWHQFMELRDVTHNRKAWKDLPGSTVRNIRGYHADNHHRRWLGIQDVKGRTAADAVDRNSIDQVRGLSL